MGWESSCVVGFDLGPLLQGQTRTAKLKGFTTRLLLCRHCGVGIRVRVNNFFSKTTRPRDMLFFKITYLSRMKNCSRHANLFVRLFARDITREVPPPKM